MKLSSLSGLIENDLSSNSSENIWEIAFDSSTDKPCTSQFIISSEISFEIKLDSSEPLLTFDGPAWLSFSSAALSHLVLTFASSAAMLSATKPA